MNSKIIATVDSVSWFGFYATSSTPGVAPKLCVSLPKEPGNPPAHEREQRCKQNAEWLGKNVEIAVRAYYPNSGAVWTDVFADGGVEVSF